MTRVLHLTSVQPPFDTRIFNKECRSLAEAGYEVVLIAGHDRDEIREGVQIHSVPSPRIRVERIVLTTLRVLMAALRERGELYHFHDPELIPVGLVLKLFGKRVIYDVHEDVPSQIRIKYWIPGWLKPCIAWITALVEKIAPIIFDHMIVANPRVISRFSSSRSTLLRNYSDPAELFPHPTTAFGSRAHRAVYIGAISGPRGVKQMVDAMELLPANLGTRLDLAGRFGPANLLSEMHKRPGWRLVDYHGVMDRDGVSGLLAQARVGLSVLHPTPNHLQALPTKLFEYMAAGLPVVVSDIPDWRDIVNNAKCGIIVDPMDTEAISEAIRWLLEHPQDAQAMGERGRKAVIDHYNWDREKESLLELYQKLLGPQ